MNPPDIIRRYLDSANAGLIDRACDCFSDDAVVRDEGGTHTGHGEIRAWILETTGKYQPQVEVVGMEQSGDAVLLTGRVSGNFPGSPVDLEYRFTLTADTISSLAIE